MNPGMLVGVSVAIIAVIVAFFVAWKIFSGKKRDKKNYARALKMVPMLIHLPPSTDDIQTGGRDERDVIGEQISEAQVMYSIIASTLKKGIKSKLYGQKHISFEIVAHDGFIKYYATVPAVLTETIKQAIVASYPTARLEEVADPNFFSKDGKIDAIAGGEIMMKQPFYYPIATYEDTKRDASLGLINALSTAKKGDGVALQILFRPTDGGWIKKSLDRVQSIKDGKKAKGGANYLHKIADATSNLAADVAEALWKPPDEHEKFKDEERQLTNLQQEEIQKIEEKTKYPGFEVLIRVVASSATKARSEAVLGSVVSVFSQFDLPQYNGFIYNSNIRAEDLARNYILRWFPQTRRSMILNSVELASIFNLPSQNAIPTSQVERQATKQVDGPAKVPEEGLLLGVNEFRGETKEIRLQVNDRRRHTYAIGATGSGKSVLLENLAYQDMCDGRGFCFIDPHGDAVEWLLSRVPQERMDDVILFEPGSMDNPVGMNMFEFQSEDQKDFIVQEGINMLTSLYDPGNQGIFGPRAQHMFRNAALLLMSDPEGGTFIDIPRCFIDPEFVKSKLQYVTDKTVYDYWTKEFPASQKSSDAGEVTSWFVSKWGPFLSNKMMRNILGQPKSGFNIREIMDNSKILLVNLSKGTTGELNAQLLGMIFVMKFQAAAMSRADTLEDDRVDFCLFVDEFQNFATESFESILSEARKYRLNLVLANQFMTQLTDKIREAIIGNVGTIMSGRIGVTDAELMEKAFSPVFTAEDLHKQPNYNWIATVMMFNTPTAPFTMRTLPPMGEGNADLMQKMRAYALSKYGRPRAEVEAEIEERLAASDEKKETPPTGPDGSSIAVGAASSAAKPAAPKKNFLDSWLEKKASLEKQAKEEAKATMIEKSASGVAPAPVPAVEPKVNPAEKVSANPSVAAKQAPSNPTSSSSQATSVKQPVSQQETKPKTVTPSSAIDELSEDGDGSVWVATATRNAEEAAPNEVAQATESDDDWAKGVKIHHEQHSVKNKPTPKPAEKPAPKPAEQAQTAGDGTVTKNADDEVVLRWR